MVRNYVPTGRPPGRPRKNSPPSGNSPPASEESSPVNPEPKQKKAVNPRHLKAARAILKGASTSEALRQAGFHPKSHHPRAVVNTLAARALVKAGGSLNKIATRHVEALNAMETKFFPQLAGVKKICRCRACGSEWSDTELVVCPRCESEEWFQTEKTDIPYENLIAHDIRLRAVIEGYKIHDAYPKHTDEDPFDLHAPVAVQVIFSSQAAPSPTQTQTQLTGVRVVLGGNGKNGGNGHG